MFLFQLISILLISVTFYTYLANIIFSCDLDFKGSWTPKLTYHFPKRAQETYIWNQQFIKTMQKTRCHVDRLTTSPHVPVVNVKYAQKHKHYKITLSTYVLLQLSCETVFFAIKNIKINW